MNDFTLGDMIEENKTLRGELDVFRLGIYYVTGIIYSHMKHGDSITQCPNVATMTIEYLESEKFRDPTLDLVNGIIPEMKVDEVLVELSRLILDRKSRLGI